MNWTKLKFLALDTVVFLAANWWIVLIAIAILVFCFIVNYQQSCRDRRDENKIEQIKEDVIEKRIESNLAANEVKHAEENKNTAVNNFADSLRIDSNKYSGANVDDKFCRRYPEDSTCAEWRRLRGAPR
jgi:hypothetical protein